MLIYHRTFYQKDCPYKIIDTKMLPIYLNLLKIGKTRTWWKGWFTGSFWWFNKFLIEPNLRYWCVNLLWFWMFCFISCNFFLSKWALSVLLTMVLCEAISLQIGTWGKKYIAIDIQVFNGSGKRSIIQNNNWARKESRKTIVSVSVT